MKRAQPGRRLAFTAVTAVIAGSLGVTGCQRHLASAQDCRAVLDRLVELELAASGYRDPALAPRWQHELARRFEPDLRRCQTLRLRGDLAACLQGARSAEEVAERCLE
jgi:hypothetical protein